MKIFTTVDIEDIIKKYNAGISSPRSKKLFYRKEIGTLNADVQFILTYDEQQEYIKCAIDIYYFIDKYCGIILRKFQRDWIKHFLENRFQLFCISRQSGFTTIINAIYLHYILFNTNKNILVMNKQGNERNEHSAKLWNLYKRVPYFMKPGICSKNSICIKFANGCTIKYKSLNLDDISLNIDILSIYDYTRFSYDVQKSILQKCMPMLRGNESRFIIQSQPKEFDMFYELVNNSERKTGDPKKNCFSTIKTYWWEVPGRDQEWAKTEMTAIGSAEAFLREYDIQFYTKRYEN